MAASDGSHRGGSPDGCHRPPVPRLRRPRGRGVTPNGIDQYFASAYLTANGGTAYNRGRREPARSALNVHSGSGDVLVRDWASQVHQNDFGWTECTDMTAYDACDTVFNNLLMDSRSVNDWCSLGCHELGHGGNLDHRYASTDSDDNSCMRNDIWPSSLDAHDINEINADWSVPHAIRPGCLNNAC